MKVLQLFVSIVPLAVSALLPVVNPVGSAVLFLGLVENADHERRKRLARRIAVDMTLFLSIVLIVGTRILGFFGISMPVVQVAGGFVLATMGWSLLNKPDAGRETSVHTPTSASNFEALAFYPLTFPLTVGPGCIVVTLTLSAHASKPELVETIVAHLAVLVGIIIVAASVYLSYAYADRLTRRISVPMIEGIMRVISFILVCIGGEIMWQGIMNLIKSLH